MSVLEYRTDEAVAQIDLACAALADLGYVGEAWDIRRVLDYHFPDEHKEGEE